MPIIPTVFRPIRANDVHVRPFKAYKRYTVTSGSFSGSGYRVHTGLHNIYAVHVGDDTYNYPINYDGVNQHVAWRSLDHRYYRYPYDPARSHEHTDRRKTEKFLFYSSSVLSIPYFEVGDSIKPGSFTVTSSVKNVPIYLEDDGLGNLRDPLILTSSFATSSRCFFYMGFNNEFRQFETNLGLIETGSIEYILNGETKLAQAQNVSITTGVGYTEDISEILPDTFGLSAQVAKDPFGPPYTVNMSQSSSILIPHDDSFNRFNKCDRWTISLWNWAIGNVSSILISKLATRNEQYFDTNTQSIRSRRVYNNAFKGDTLTNININYDLSLYRFPFLIGYSSNRYYFKCSNGSRELVISSSAIFNSSDSWRHIAVVNDNNYVTIYVNGIAYQSASMISDSTANNADIELFTIGGPRAIDNVLHQGKLDEIRFYDYALPQSQIDSLRNRHYISGSLLQTNVAGNIFYRNGQVTVTSAHPKYNSGSGFFNSAFTASYRGTHTIYENEVLVRVPSDQFNYTLNPTATYRPGTDASNNNCNSTPNGAESNNGPGELYLSSFVSGTVGPYITTVGLYNDKQQLLAVGKLGTAITKRPDVDTNIIIRWDY